MIKFFSLLLQGGGTAVVANIAGDFWSSMFGLGFFPLSFLKYPNNNADFRVVVSSSTWQFG